MLALMVVRLSGSLMLLKEVQFIKAFFPMDVRVFGSKMFVNDEQLKKALS
jgi:hypothetical protein